MKTKIALLSMTSTLATLAYAGKSVDMQETKIVQEEAINNAVTSADYRGKSVVDMYGEKIATIHDLKIDKEEHSVTDAYLSVGGLMGIGNDYISVPLAELEFNQEENHYQLSTTKSDFMALIDTRKEAMEKIENDYTTTLSQQAYTMWDGVKTDLGLNDVDVADIEVTIVEEKLILEGSVRDKALKKSIAQMFNERTDLKVVNKIKVEQS